MKKVLSFFAVVMLFGLVNGSAAADDSCAVTIKRFERLPALSKFFNDSYGYAVFPTIGKGGFVIGGSYGEGRVYRAGQATAKVKMVEGSIGFQLGGKAFSEIIFFQDERAYTEFMSGNFEFDATAQAIAITAGAGAHTGTAGKSAGVSVGPDKGHQAETNYVKGMATFVHSKGGFMCELSLGGQKFIVEAIK